jgi:plasmid maintenance system antidote protein VapI
MKEGVLQRIIIICQQRSDSETQFAKMIGANQKTINQQLRGERSLSFDTILKTLSAFEDISSEWLLRGEGNMIKPQHEQTVEPQTALISAEGNTPEASVLYQIYNDTVKKMQELVEENTKLKAQVTELSEGSEELAKVLRSYHDSNQELADENQQLKVEIMIKESQLKEREKVILDYKELLKEAI